MGHWFLSKEFEKRKKKMYEEIVHAFSGIINVINKDGTVIYSQNLAKTSGNSGKDWIDTPLQQWADCGFISATPSLKSLKTGQTETSYISKKDSYAIVSIANPVFNDEGEVENVVAFSLSEGLIHDFSKIISDERNRGTQLANYLSNYAGQDYFFASNNESIQKLLETLSRVAHSDANILITGETGSGKEVFSRFVHANSNRASEVFVPVNCSAIPSELMESEFFGYEKGAFTGASREGKSGLFELANNGTLFLDEIGELPLSMQPKLLRILESKEYRKVGGTTTHKVDVRVICATNRDLYKMVKEGKFREDLYYRLNVIPARIPPLRERTTDIIPMATMFLDKLNKKYNTSKVFSDRTLQYLTHYSWPGNVRELSNTVEKLYFTAIYNVLDVSVDATTDTKSIPVLSDAPLDEMDLSLPLKETMRRYEQKYIEAVLKSCNGKVALAADKLEITRAGLYKKLDSYKAENSSQK